MEKVRGLDTWTTVNEGVEDNGVFANIKLESV
jgi:hypothetical protein